MQTNHKVLWLAVSAIFAMAMPVSAAPPKYAVTDLGTLGGSQSHAYGINNLGQIVGTAYQVPTGDPGGFLYAGTGPMQGIPTLSPIAINDAGQVISEFSIAQTPTSTPALFPTLGGTYVYAAGMNNLGLVVGYSSIPSGSFPEHAFLYSGPDKIQDLGSLEPQESSYARSINDDDQVVGYAYVNVNGENVPHAFLWTSSTGMVDISNSPDPITDAMAINNLGQIVGTEMAAGGDPSDVFVTTIAGGPLQDIGSLNGRSMNPYSINNRGQFVGNAYDGSGSVTPANVAFIGSFDGPLEDLNLLIDPASGWTLLSAQSINDLGQIVGYGINPNGETHAFLLTPVPEPSMLGFVFFGAGVFSRRCLRAATSA